MKNTIRTLLIQWIALGLIWNPAFAQNTGSATQDIANKYKYKDYIHQSTIDKFEAECDQLPSGCPQTADYDATNGIDVASSTIAQLAMGAIMVGGLASIGKLFQGGALSSKAEKEAITNAEKAVDNAKSVQDSTQKALDNTKVDFTKPSDETSKAFTENHAAKQNLANKNQELKDAKQAKQKKDSQKLGKICKLIATAGVIGLTIADKTQTTNLKKKYLKASTEIAQAEALYTVANSHENKRKANATKAAIFGATTVCFAAAAVVAYYAETDKVVEYGIYAGLAGTLMGLSMASKGKHKKMSERALKAAKSIPKKGECHPETPCFCAEQREVSEVAHNAAFEKHCIADELQRGDTTSIAMACIDAKGQTDLACECRTNNTCLDSTLNQQIISMDIDPKLKSQLTDSLSIISRGELSAADANKLEKRGQFFKAIADKELDKNLSGQPPVGDPELARAFKGSGMSENSALIASNIKLSPSQRKRLSQITGATIPKSYRIGSSRSKNKYQAKKKAQSFNFDFNTAAFKMLEEQNKTAEMDPAKRLEEYKRRRAQKRAVAMAEINPMENEPIFNIISQRYLKSGLIKVGN